MVTIEMTEYAKPTPSHDPTEIRPKPVSGLDEASLGRLIAVNTALVLLLRRAPKGIDA